MIVGAVMHASLHICHSSSSRVQRRINLSGHSVHRLVGALQLFFTVKTDDLFLVVVVSVIHFRQFTIFTFALW